MSNKNRAFRVLRKPWRKLNYTRNLEKLRISLRKFVKERQALPMVTETVEPPSPGVDSSPLAEVPRRRGPIPVAVVPEVMVEFWENVMRDTRAVAGEDHRSIVTSEDVRKVVRRQGRQKREN